MSKNSNVSLGKLAGFLAFAAILIKGLVFLINWILGLVDGSVDLGALVKIADLSLVVASFICAWFFVLTAKLPGKRIVWQVILLIITVLAVLGALNIF